MKLDRRKALQLFGTMFVCLVASKTSHGDTTLDSAIRFSDTQTRPLNYHFIEAGIGDIIIEKKNGQELRVPFSEIVDALEEI